MNPQMLEYLRVNNPYLYRIELKVKEIQQNTGFGDISINLILREGKVKVSDIGAFVKEKYE